jgi:hypothetical protein
MYSLKRVKVKRSTSRAERSPSQNGGTPVRATLSLFQEINMISSIIWLILLQTGNINPEHAPWSIYLPVCLVEVIVYFKCLTKIK